MPENVYGAILILAASALLAVLLHLRKHRT